VKVVLLPKPGVRTKVVWVWANASVAGGRMFSAV
jgi:hypothetical protein